MSQQTIRVDLSVLTFGDMEQLFLAKEHQLPVPEEIALLDRIVEGGVRKRKLSGEVYQALLAAAWNAITAALNPEDPEGKN